MKIKNENNADSEDKTMVQAKSLERSPAVRGL